MDVSVRSIAMHPHAQAVTGRCSKRLPPRVRMSEPGSERRRHLRWPVFWRATVSDENQSKSCLVLDFSPGGARVRSEAGAPVGRLVALDFPGAIQLIGKLVWQRGGILGIEFREDAQECAELTADILAERAAAC